MGVSDRLGTIAPGQEANLIVFRWDSDKKSIDLRQTILAGEVVYEA